MRFCRRPLRLRFPRRLTRAPPRRQPPSVVRPQRLPNQRLPNQRLPNQRRPLPARRRQPLPNHQAVAHQFRRPRRWRRYQPHPWCPPPPTNQPSTSTRRPASRRQSRPRLQPRISPSFRPPTPAATSRWPPRLHQRLRILDLARQRTSRRRNPMPCLSHPKRPRKTDHPPTQHHPQIRQRRSGPPARGARRADCVGLRAASPRPSPGPAP